MKKFLVVLVAFLAFSVVGLVAETNLDVVYLKSGEVLRGKIVRDVPFDYLELKLQNGVIKKINYQDMQKREFEPVKEEANPPIGYTISKVDKYPKKGSVGFGFGIPYGLLGLNMELTLTDAFSGNVGLGYAIYGLGLNVGARGYLTPRKSAFRPFFDLNFGTNGALIDYEKTYMGLNAGFGFKWMFGRNKQTGIEVEAIYILTSGLYDELDKLEQQGYDTYDNGRFKYSLGYRVGF